MIQVVLISQYRKRVALKHGYFLKSVIFFKSKDIEENKNHYLLFQETIEILNVTTVNDQKSSANEGVLKKVFDFFEKEKIEFSHLIEELKEDFSEYRLLIIDSKNKTDEKLGLLITHFHPYHIFFINQTKLPHFPPIL